MTDKQAAGFIGTAGKWLGGLGRTGASKAKSIGGSVFNKAAPLAKTVVQGNEMEGAMLGSQMFTGYAPGLAGQMGLGLGFDLARPHLVKGLGKLDDAFVKSFGGNANAMGLRNATKSGLNKFTQLSKWAPAAQFVGGIQEGTIGFNQFDPYHSVQAGREATTNDIAKTLGWGDGQSMLTELTQFRPLIEGAKRVGRTLTSAGNRVADSVGNSLLSSVPDEHIERFVDKALSAYGESFVNKSPQDQAAIVRTLYETAARHGEI